MISAALAVLMTALGLKKARKFDEALQTFDQAIESLLGLNANLIKQLDDSSLLDMLTFLGKLDVDRLLVLADIYREKSEVYSFQGRIEDQQFAAKRSLRFYLEVMLSDSESTSLELIQKIENLRQEFTSIDLHIETRLALLDYLERLLNSNDEFLATAGLSRIDLQRAFNSLESTDLH
jgi:hypothetical protein